MPEYQFGDSFLFSLSFMTLAGWPSATPNGTDAAMLKGMLNDVRNAKMLILTRAAKPPMNRYKMSCTGIGALCAL
jgi:hypothetical protein